MPSFRVVGPGRADDPTAAAADVSLDLLVIGSGVAGLSAAVRATDRGLSLVTVAGALVALAGARSEFGGAHTREDFPDTDDRRCRRILIQSGQASIS